MQYLPTFILLGCFISFPTEAANQKYRLPRNEHTLISHNTSSIQTNMVEFTGIFSGNLHPIENASVQKKAYRTLLSLGTFLKNDESQTLRALIPKKVLKIFVKEVIIPWYTKAFQDLGMGLKAKKSVETFYKTHARSTLQQLFFGELIHRPSTTVSSPLHPNDWGLIDKSLRILGVHRYSIMDNVMSQPSDFVKKGTISLKLLMKKWSQSMGPAISHKDFISPKKMTFGNELEIFNAAHAMFLTAVLDCYLWEKVAQQHLFKTVSTIKNTFYQSPLGNATLKNARLIDLYLKNQADIICLQESDQALVQCLIQEKGFFSKDQTYGVPLENASRILLSKDRWDEKKSKALHLSTQIVSDYLTTGKAPQGSEARCYELIHSKEVKIVLAIERHSKKAWMIVSAHSDSKGKDSLIILGLVDALRKRIDSLKKLPLILAHDANTTHYTRRGGLPHDKLSVDTYLNHCHQFAFHPLFGANPLKHVATIRKRRSYLQTQPDKAMRWFIGRSDLVTMSNLSIVRKKLILPGPNLHENPCDHAILIGTVRHFNSSR